MAARLASLRAAAVDHCAAADHFWAQDEIQAQEQAQVCWALV